MLRRLAIAWSLLSLAGCASASLQHQCPDCDSSTIAVSSPLSPLLALTRIKESIPKRVHVYIEGDGRPWDKYLNRPAQDPNSRRLTALELMQVDRAETVYLSRPCYGMAPMPAACTPADWSGGRYSEKIVEAMNEALSVLAGRYSSPELVLIGHSGGGTLAMLLAQRRQDVTAVLTLAANLDHQQWADHFGYLPLEASLNAVDVHLPPRVVRWHLAAGQDQSVPAALVAKAAQRDQHALLLTFDTFDHTCCWMQIWPSILEDLDRELAQRAR